MGENGWGQFEEVAGESGSGNDGVYWILSPLWAAFLILSLLRRVPAEPPNPPPLDTTHSL